MTSAESSSENSTNVRFSGSEHLRRAGVRALSWLAPELVAGWAERAFLTPRRHARPAREEEWLRSAQRGEVRYRTALLPTYSWGAGPAVLLVHGWEGRATQLGSFVPALLAAGYRVIAVDMPGHGEAPPSLSSLADFTFALTTIIQRLGPFHAVIGHSMGGAAAALSHSLRPFAGRLVTIGSPRAPGGYLDDFAAYLGLSAELRARVARRIDRRYGMAIMAVDVSRFGARVDIPTLVIHDRDDKEVPFAHALAIAQALPQATLTATEGLGHRRILRDPAVIARALSFLAPTAPDELSFSPAA